MKNQFYLKSLVFCAFLTMSLQGQAQNTVETSFTVSGVCGMCESRIEAAVDVRGVKMADYDLDTHTLHIAYKPSKISEGEIHALLNSVGHDTEQSQASDEAYEQVHHCCKYRGHEDH